MYTYCKCQVVVSSNKKMAGHCYYLIKKTWQNMSGHCIIWLMKYSRPIPRKVRKYGRLLHHVLKNIQYVFFSISKFFPVSNNFCFYFFSFKQFVFSFFFFQLKINYGPNLTLCWMNYCWALKVALLQMFTIYCLFFFQLLQKKN